MAVKIATSRTQLTKILREQAGKDFVNIGEIAELFGRSRDTAHNIVRGLDCYIVGASHTYLVDDIARKLDLEKIPGTWTL